MRYLFTIKEFFKHHQSLKQYLHNPKLKAATVESISNKQLIANKIQIVIVDFDGVLASHGQATPDQSAISWLHEITAEMMFKKVVILSNKPNSIRKDFFITNFPNIDFFIASKKKPYPDGINAILKKYNCPKEQAILIDDRLATGILASIIVGIQAIYITQPKMSWRSRIIAESFFYLLRFVEKLVAKCF